ncbi:MAG: alpha/beta hydrolase family protein [Pseudomonadota bacterium]
MNIVTFQQLLDLPAGQPNSVIAYGTEAAQFGELWLPAPGAEGPAPLVVLIHGGCWRSEFDIAHIRPASAALAAAGFAVWAIEYRRIGDPGGGWPGTFLDVAAGVDFVRGLDPTIVNTRRVLLVGHSAGGHLATWAASRVSSPGTGEIHTHDPVPVAGVVGLAAIVDLDRYALGASSCERATRELMGGLPDEVPERYQQASPRHLVLHPNTRMVHGINDRIVPLDQITSLRLSPSRVVALSGVGHFDLVYPEAAAFERVLGTIRAAFAQ